MRRVVALLAAVAAGCMALERPLVFQPSPPPAHPRPPGGVEEAHFTAPDGTRLHGWFATPAKPRAVVLYAHGNAGNVADGPDVLALYRDTLNAAVLVFDYRGYGKSEGTPSEAGILADARAARAWLVARCGVAESDVVLVGRSLGGGVAVDLAAKDGARGLVLESTFTSLPDVAGEHFPLLPAKLLMRTRLDSLSKIPAYRGPLLQTHGEADQVVPFALGKALFDAAPGSKRFVRVPKGGHNDPPGADYLAALDAFLGSLPAATR